MKKKVTAKAAVIPGTKTLAQNTILFTGGKIQAIVTLLRETNGGHLPDEVRQELNTAYYAVNRAARILDPWPKD